MVVAICYLLVAIWGYIGIQNLQSTPLFVWSALACITTILSLIAKYIYLASDDYMVSFYFLFLQITKV